MSDCNGTTRVRSRSGCLFILRSDERGIAMLTVLMMM